MPENPMDAVTWNFTQEQFLQALDDAKHEQAKAIEEHCSKARALKTKVSDEEGEASNSKVAAGASAFVGAYGGIDDFLAGLDAIGLPHPRISDGMFAEFNSSNDSDITWETSNYGGIKSTPRLEWEFVANPEMNKIYPGGRLPIKIEMFLYAVKAEGYNVELDNAPLDKCETLFTCLTGALLVHMYKY